MSFLYSIDEQVLALWTQWLVFISTACGICITLYKMVLKKMFNKIAETYKAAHNAIYSVEGLKTDLKEVKDLINRELRYNGGSSIKDSITAIKSDLSKIEAKRSVDLMLSNGYVWETDANGYCIWANKNMLNLLDCSFDDLRNLNWLSIVHPDDREMVEEDFADSRRNKNNWILRYRLVTSDNQIIQVCVNGHPICDKQNNLLGYLGIIEEVVKVKK